MIRNASRLSDEDIQKVFVDLYDGWYSSIVRYVGRLTGSVSIAEDHVHECFLLLCRELRRGKRIDNPKGWLFRVIHNELGKSKPTSRTTNAVVSLDAFENPDCCPELAVEMDVEIGDLSRMLACLTLREEEVIMLRLEGFTYAEVAATLGIGHETVKTLMARAITRLREMAAPGAPVKRRREHNAGTDLS